MCQVCLAQACQGPTRDSARLHAKFSVMQAAFLSFLCYITLQCTKHLILLRYMLSLMEKMCRCGEDAKASRSRVTNLVSKTYSRVALVIDLWDQTGPDWSPPWNGGVTPQGPQPPFRSHRTSATRPESRPSLAHLSLASSSTSGIPLVLCTLTRRSLQWTSMS